MNNPGKWRVQKCKSPSTRWVAWRLKQKKKSGRVFESHQKALLYAVLQYGVEALMGSLNEIPTPERDPTVTRGQMIRKEEAVQGYGV